MTGELFDHLTCWDALRAALPVGTVSGAPKVCSATLFCNWNWSLSLDTQTPNTIHGVQFPILFRHPCTIFLWVLAIEVYEQLSVIID